MPTLYILGRSQWGWQKLPGIKAAWKRKSINRELPFVNVDLIAMRKLGGVYS